MGLWGKKAWFGETSEFCKKGGGRGFSGKEAMAISEGEHLRCHQGVKQGERLSLDSPTAKLIFLPETPLGNTSFFQGSPWRL